MTFDATIIGQTPFLVQIREQNPRQIALLKLKVQPLLKVLLGMVSLLLGLRLILDSGPVMLIGLALLMRGPAYCYLGWRQYCDLKDARVTLTLGWYLKGYRRDLSAERAA